MKKSILFDDKIQIELYPIDKEAIFEISNKEGGNNSGNSGNDPVATKNMALVSDLEQCCPPLVIRKSCKIDRH